MVWMVQTAAVQNFREDPKQYGPPLRYRYHTFLSEPSLPAVVRVRSLGYEHPKLAAAPAPSRPAA